MDDNFIGNKKLAKQFLPVLKDWLVERRWPFEFTTEASINLADDAELLGADAGRRASSPSSSASRVPTRTP